MASTPTAAPDSPTIPLPGKRGRPLAYTPELADEICARLAEGQALVEICRDDHMPARGTVMHWVTSDVCSFSAQYTRARELQWEYWADDQIMIADDATNDYMERQLQSGVTKVVDAEHVNRSRLRIETRRWLLSKLKPGTYGDKLDMKVTGTVGLSVAEILRQRRERRLDQPAAPLTIPASCEPAE